MDVINFCIQTMWYYR